MGIRVQDDTTAATGCQDAQKLCPAGDGTRRNRRGYRVRVSAGAVADCGSGRVGRERRGGIAWERQSRRSGRACRGPPSPPQHPLPWRWLTRGGFGWEAAAAPRSRACRDRPHSPTASPMAMGEGENLARGRAKPSPGPPGCRGAAASRRTTPPVSHRDGRGGASDLGEPSSPQDPGLPRRGRFPIDPCPCQPRRGGARESGEGHDLSATPGCRGAAVCRSMPPPLPGPGERGLGGEGGPRRARPRSKGGRAGRTGAARTGVVHGARAAGRRDQRSSASGSSAVGCAGRRTRAATSRAAVRRRSGGRSRSGRRNGSSPGPWVA